MAETTTMAGNNPSSLPCRDQFNGHLHLKVKQETSLDSEVDRALEDIGVICSNQDWILLHDA